MSQDNQEIDPASITVPDEIEILKHYSADPNCKSCHGRGRLGINKIYQDKKWIFQLQFCHCLLPKENEFAKLQRLLNELISNFTELNKIQRDNVNLLDRALTKIDRHTAGYWIEKSFNKCLKGYEALLNLTKRSNAKPGAEEVRRPAQQG